MSWDACLDKVGFRFGKRCLAPNNGTFYCQLLYWLEMSEVHKGYWDIIYIIYNYHMLSLGSPNKNKQLKTDFVMARFSLNNQALYHPSSFPPYTPQIKLRAKVNRSMQPKPPLRHHHVTSRNPTQMDIWILQGLWKPPDMIPDHFRPARNEYPWEVWGGVHWRFGSLRFPYFLGGARYTIFGSFGNFPRSEDEKLHNFSRRFGVFL